MSRRKDLSLMDKVEILHELEKPGVKQSHIVKCYGISSSQASRLVQKKAKILDEFESHGTNRARKRNRSGKEAEVEDAPAL